jgi:hypothetical protein
MVDPTAPYYPTLLPYRVRLWKGQDFATSGVAWILQRVKEEKLSGKDSFRRS